MTSFERNLLERESKSSLSNLVSGRVLRYASVRQDMLVDMRSTGFMGVIIYASFRLTMLEHMLSNLGHCLTDSRVVVEQLAVPPSVPLSESGELLGDGVE